MTTVIVLKFDQIGRRGATALAVPLRGGTDLDAVATSIEWAVKKSNILATRHPDIRCWVDDAGRLVGDVSSGWRAFPFTGPLVHELAEGQPS